MAQIVKMERVEMDRDAVHESVEATYSVFKTDEGATYLQTDTCGSPNRQIPGKKSRSIQFGPEGLKALTAILESL